MIKYDKRKGWRGPITNVDLNKDWRNDLEEYTLEESIGWEIAIVKEINKFYTSIETKSKS